MGMHGNISKNWCANTSDIRGKEGNITRDDNNGEKRKEEGMNKKRWEKLSDMMKNLYYIIKTIHRTLIIVHIYSIFTF